jgi:YVTN family beta-propeller protein
MRFRQALAFAAAALLSACAPIAAGPERGGGTLLVGNKGEDTLSFVDLASGRELARVPTGRMPHEIAVSPDGRQAAVVAYGGTSIDIFDVAGRAKLRTIELAPNQGPHGLLWLSDGRLVATTERSRTLTVVDTRQGDRVTPIPTDQQGTHMVAVSPDRRRAYTANIPAGTVSVIDLASGRKLRDVRVGGAPEGIALTPDGRTLWVADLEGARVQAFDTAVLDGPAGGALLANVTVKVKDGSPDEIERTVVKPIERALRGLAGIGSLTSSTRQGETWINAEFNAGARITEAEVGEAVRSVSAGFPQGRTAIDIRMLDTVPLTTVRTGPRPIRVAVSPDGRWVVTSNYESGTLSLIDARTRRLVREIPISGSAEAGQVTILFSADGSRLYAAETGRDQVAEVEMPSGRVLRRLPAGKNGDGLAIAP